MLKVNNFTAYSSVSIVNFEHVIGGWDQICGQIVFDWMLSRCAKNDFSQKICHKWVKGKQVDNYTEFVCFLFCEQENPCPSSMLSESNQLWDNSEILLRGV